MKKELLFDDTILSLILKRASGLLFHIYPTVYINLILSTSVSQPRLLAILAGKHNK